MSSTTDSTEQPLHLLKLPGEIRNLIYHFAVVKSHAIEISFRYSETPIRPALASTCRMLRKEVLSIYYSENTFDLKVSWFFHTHIFRRWLSKHESLLADLTKVQLTCAVGLARGDHSIHSFRTYITLKANLLPDGSIAIKDMYLHSNVAGLTCLCAFTSEGATGIVSEDGEGVEVGKLVAYIYRLLEISKIATVARTPARFECCTERGKERMVDRRGTNAMDFFNAACKKITEGASCAVM